MSAVLLLAALGSTARALPDDYKLGLEGYYRTRYYTYRTLFPGQEEPGRFMTHKLRLQPQVDFEDRAKFFMMADVLDDSLWGDNQSLASTSLFAGDPSNTGFDGIETETFQLKRAWMDFKLPVGAVRIGRQPSHWGMGLLANSGDGFDDTFGENHFGSTYDRVLFATRPISVFQGLTGRDDAGIPFIVGFAVDRLVEDPLIQYYGYECEEDATSEDDDWNPDCDTDGDGVVSEAESHGLTDDEYIQEQRGEDWWLDGSDDVRELVYLAIYRGEGVDLMGSKGDLHAGFYAVNRTQDETSSNVWILDAYFKLLWRGIYLEGEGINIRGHSSAIALPGAFDPSGEVEDPLYKDVNIWGYVGRAGFVQPSYSAVFETGYASGDNNIIDQDFTGRPLHADYNVGLILYEEVLARTTAATWGEGASGLWSNGGVYNSRYVFPTVTYKPRPKIDIIGGFLMAWPDRPDGAIIQCAEGDEHKGEALDCAQYNATEKSLGWEADLAVKYKIHNDHINFSLEGGYASVTDRIPLEFIGLNPEGKFMTIQTRFAYEF